MMDKRQTVERVRTCFFCENKKEKVDYKDERLIKFISERGKISDRSRSGLCATHQRIVSQAIKRARHLALLPFVMENIR